ncbi:DNA replication protein [Pantoea sp. Fr+CA_20]|uniref:DNA replication protein n=1 Tax=Pantoea sp. Fr+CA_20 TaxID=2929506 RepID=UPI00211760D2|nr:DNA replication protein [Pantoea sp. Fr+CA_20]
MSNVIALPKATPVRTEAAVRGFALIHRKIKQLPFYNKDSEAVHLWVHLIMEMNHAPETVATDYGDVVIGRGQKITGAPTLSKETGIELERVKYLLKKFRKLEMISTYSPGKFTIITVEKYDEYQGEINRDFLPQVSPVIPSIKPVVATDGEVLFPHDSLDIPTNNNIINNNSISNDIECAPVPSEQPTFQTGNQDINEPKKPAFSCEEVLAVYHEVLPEAKAVRLLSDKRRNQIRTFWKKATKMTRQLDGVPFTLESWRQYLTYIAENCRWMLEDRQDQRSGRVWHRKGLEYFLNDETYLLVREGAKDDR